MGFAESFEKSFVPAAGKGADMAMEAIKEKIKLDTETKKQEAESANDVATAFSIAQSTGDQKLIKSIQDLAYTEENGKLKANKLTAQSAKAALTLASGGFNLMQKVKALDTKTKTPFMVQIGDDGKPRTVNAVTGEVVTDQ